MNFSATIRQNPVATFIGFTLPASLASLLIPFPPESAFAMTALLVVFIPTIVSFTLVALMDGRQGVRAFRKAVLNWHVAFIWVLIALVLGFVLHIGSSILALVTGRISTIAIAAPTAFLIAYFPLALLEEIGWRGFALRRLLDQFSPFKATLLIGIPWASLHFALFIVHPVPDSSPIAEMLAVFAWTFPLTWIFVRSGRSVLVTTVLHGAMNGFGFAAVSIAPAEVLWFAFASACVVDTCLILADWRMWFARGSKISQAAQIAMPQAH